MGSGSPNKVESDIFPHMLIKEMSNKGEKDLFKLNTLERSKTVTQPVFGMLLWAIGLEKGLKHTSPRKMVCLITVSTLLIKGQGDSQMITSV